ncbi:GBS Bsp-like repeat-containing protein [Streptococcus alactolyticus]|uniref:GBS Bsp-like repeat-containing protein n=2 Tax=Streptococcus alactolyticus TaxID=29389 RepID=UPI001F24CBB0|nr:GBS Bsp-like repeat-containing protein [Streptococcus alactolyticus]MCF2666704.1 GBS Bsp-like repeat-containing protein [Streptococcus alactolyticus]MCF2678540.1 GBS Bsp-like repeat-containing protein [Streptococcus alactolyticus]
MKTKGHGTIKKSKAYGAIGTLLLSGVLVAAMGTTAVQADETVENSSATETLASTLQVATESTAATATDSEVSVGDTKTSETEANKTVISDSAKSTTPVEVEKTTETSSTTENTDAEVVKPAESTVPEKTETEAASATSVPEKTETEVAGVTTEATNVVEENENNSTESTEAEEDSTEPAKEMASTEATSEESSAEELVASETEAKVISEDAEAADQSKHGATGGGTGVTDRVTDVYLGSNGFNIQYNQPIADGAKIMFAVWSDKNGQDDLIWYTADSHGKTTAKYTGSYGKYHIHTYQNLNGKMTGLNGTSIIVPEPSAKVTITKASETSYKVTVSDVPVYISSVQLPTWTQANDQDDLIWYKTTKDSNTTYSAIISVAEHNLESGRYNVHVYGTSAITNALTGLAGTHFEADYHFGDVVVDATLAKDGIDLTMPSDVSKGMAVYHAVWSAENDQDDIVWYKADPSGHTKANYTGSYGTYLVHTYGVVHGQMVGLNATSVLVPKPEVKANITKESATTYKVTITDVPIYIDDIQVPTWTEANGQDDLQWYKAEKAADGSYCVVFSEATHNLEAGTYNVHVYGYNHVKKVQTGLLGKRFESDYRFGDVAVKAELAPTGIYITMPSDVSSNLKTYHAVWSAKNDQDDIKWYQVAKNGQLTASYTGDYGAYYIHTYAVVKGKMTCISGTSIDVPKPDVKVSVTQASDTSAKVVVTNVPIYVHDIEVPVWTSQNGQDDIKWYKAEKAADGSYTYTFYAKNHNFESGHYNVHVYGVSEVTHSLVGFATTSGIDLTFNQNLTAPTVTVQNHNADKGTLQVVIAETETSKSIASVSVAAWSEAEQKNIHWYTTSHVVNGKVIVTVDEKYHHNLTGNYTVHTYIKTKDGSTIGYNLGQCAFNNTQSTTSVTATYKGTGVYGVTISGVYSNGSVKYAVWSDVNGQDDIKWYDASVSQAVATGLINVANHSGTGTYHLHAYQSDNGKMYLLGKTEFTVKKTSYNTPYYNQKDERWGNTLYGGYKMGATGCVPTSLSMIISSLSGKEILPTMVADYLYYDTVEFNRGSQGTSGNGVLLASKHFGMTPTALGSVNELTNALKEGHYVSASVQMNKFSPWPFGTSHAIVLKGYSNGNTYVLDPYNAANNGWYPIDALWREQSTQYEDIAALGHPFVKITDI